MTSASDPWVKILEIFRIGSMQMLFCIVRLSRVEFDCKNTFFFDTDGILRIRFLF